MEQGDLSKGHLPEPKMAQRSCSVIREELLDRRREFGRKERLISRVKVDIDNSGKSDKPAMLGSDTSMTEKLTVALFRCRQIKSEIAELENELMGRWISKSMLPEITDRD